MDEMKNYLTEDGDPEMERLAEQAKALEDAAKEEAAAGGWERFTHTFPEPFTYAGKTFDSLTFDWGKLTGKDSLAIESDIALRTGRAVANPKFSGEYLAGMAVRACTSRTADGQRPDLDTLLALPLGVFQKICGSARNFLMLSELLPATAVTGSGNKS